MMSCEQCDNEFDDNKKIAFYRWGKANVGFIGCDEHLREIFDVLSQYQKGELKHG